MHICVSKLIIIGSDNGLSPGRRQAIIWTNVGILLIGSLGTNFSEILIEIQTFSLKKIHLKMSSAKCCSFRLGLNVLTHCPLETPYGIMEIGHHWFRQSSGTMPLPEPIISEALWHSPAENTPQHQGSFWVWAQPMRDDVTLKRCFSLAKPIPRMVHEDVSH